MITHASGCANHFLKELDLKKKIIYLYMIEISNYGLAEKETGKQVPRNRSTTKAASALPWKTKLPVNNEGRIRAAVNNEVG